MKKLLLLIIIMIVLISPAISQSTTYSIDVELPKIGLTSVPFDIRVLSKQTIEKIKINDRIISSNRIISEKDYFKIKNIKIDESGLSSLEIITNQNKYIYDLNVIPAWLAILPPIIAILLALVTRQMIISLFAGIWFGVGIINGYNFFAGFFITFNDYLVKSLAKTDHASIIIFSLLFGGMVGIISKNGGMRGIVQMFSKYANSRRKGLLATSLLGTVIFFDDYANTLLVGNTMRPFTDKLKISREKLSYIVDSTAAPIANLAPISTWAVFKMSLLIEPYQNANITQSPYITFLKSIPYSFYGIFSLLLLYSLALMKRDYGPMLDAERRALQENKLLRDGANPIVDENLIQNDKFSDDSTHWANAILPIVSVILTTIISLYITGKNNLKGLQPTLRNIVGNANSFSALMWAAAVGCFVALLLTLLRGILSLEDTIDAWLSGIKSMVLAVIILILAWSLGLLTQDMQTATYIIHITRDIISPVILPISVFILSATVAFSTGTSWGTMSIFVPLVIPLALSMVDSINSPIYLSSFAAILSGATLGDHCSPISDTTILSSMASGSDHIDHVKTQIPYSILAGLVAIVFGFLPAGFQIYNPVLLIIGLISMILFIYFGGKSWESIK